MKVSVKLHFENVDDAQKALAKLAGATIQIEKTKEKKESKTVAPSVQITPETGGTKEIPADIITEEINNDDMFGLGETEEKEETPTATLEMVIQELGNFAKKKGKQRALEILSTYKVKNIRELKAEKYESILTMIKKYSEAK